MAKERKSRTRTEASAQNPRKAGKKRVAPVLEEAEEEGEAATGNAESTAPKDGIAAQREHLRQEIFNQVLAEYHDKPEAEEREPDPPPRYYPLYGVRKLLGWAHVGLHDAVMDGGIKTVKSSLARIARKNPKRINDYDAEGRTALTLAVKIEREDLADMILSCKSCELMKPDLKTGLTPLHHAAQLNLLSTAQKLLFGQCYPDVQDKIGMTPLMLACRMGQSEVVELLIVDHEADIDMTDNAGWSALFYAVLANEGNICAFLLQMGADKTKKDKRGMMAVEWGEYKGFGELCAFLDSYEAQII
ncbi:unnamed protein product [Chrysoparadoxa australica]